jgi:hypothetical protein
MLSDNDDDRTSILSPTAPKSVLNHHLQLGTMNVVNTRFPSPILAVSLIDCNQTSQKKCHFLMLALGAEIAL